MDFGILVQICIGSIFINNFILSRYLGFCPFFGVSKKLSNAFGMGMAVIFVMALAATFTWIFNNYALKPQHLEYLQTIVFILVIAALVQLVEMVMLKFTPALYEALGIYLPLITTNCAILGAALINAGQNPYSGKDYTFVEALVNGVSSGLGFTLALLLMAGIRERLDLADIPRPLKGLPIAFISAGLMAIAFLGFSGLSFTK